MNEEEKEAIKYFYNLRATIYESNMLFDEDINVKCGKETIKQITTVLNLLENKDKEIKFQKEINKTEQDRHKKTEKSLKGQLEKKDKQIEQYQNMLATNDMLHVLECEKKDKMIDEIQREVREHISFENRLKRDNREPDSFNQGRFYVANNINNILKGK